MDESGLLQSILGKVIWLCFIIIYIFAFMYIQILLDEHYSRMKQKESLAVSVDHLVS